MDRRADRAHVALVNSVSARAAIPRPTAEEVRRSYMDEMDRHLHLRADQITSINQVLDNTRARFKEIHQKIAPEMKALKEQEKHFARDHAVRLQEQNREQPPLLCAAKRKRAIGCPYVKWAEYEEFHRGPWPDHLLRVVPPATKHAV